MTKKDADSLDKLGMAYLGVCLFVYRINIRPSSESRLQSNACKRMAAIANALISRFPPKIFGGFLDEYQFMVDLWTAHFIVDNFSKFPQMYNLAALGLIERCASGPADEQLAAEEREWLMNNQPLIQSIRANMASGIDT